MTMEREDYIVAVVAAAGGRLTGRTRLQKVIYLLDQLGLDTGFHYAYHHYGPYSDDVVLAAEDAKFYKKINETDGFRRSDGLRYSVYEAQVEPVAEVFGRLEQNRVRGILANLQGNSSTVLELAATIHWLHTYENVTDWQSELKRRKGAKTEGGRMGKALALLSSLGLPPANEQRLQ